MKCVQVAVSIRKSSYILDLILTKNDTEHIGQQVKIIDLLIVGPKDSVM
jgi:Trp operon repressor